MIAASNSNTCDTITYSSLNKRKLDTNINKFNEINNLLENNQYKIYNNYYNPLNCDKVILCDNHIYFNATINKDSIEILKSYINTIIANMHLLTSTPRSTSTTTSTTSTTSTTISNLNNKSIYLHIDCIGGYIVNLLEFIEFKKSNNIEFISIIKNNVCDMGIVLAAVCDYRIINKNANCKLTPFLTQPIQPTQPTQPTQVNTNYWGFFKQCNNTLLETTQLKTILYDLLTNTIDSKLTANKLDIYLTKTNFWDAKKYKKLGLADEII